jgi:hypothetical protein
MDRKKSGKEVAVLVQLTKDSDGVNALNLHISAQNLSNTSLVDVVSFPLDQLQQQIKCGICSKSVGKHQHPSDLIYKERKEAHCITKLRII